MKQVARRGLKDIVVEEVPEPSVRPHHVIVRPSVSLISSGTETASIHRDSLVKEVADNPQHVRKILDVMSVQGPVRTVDEVRAKFSELAVLGYSGAGVVTEAHRTVTAAAVGDRVAYGGEGTGHGEYIVTGELLTAKVPDSVTDEQAAFTTLGAIAMNAVRTAQLGLGETVAVIGLGLVGQLTAQLARATGARVLVTDLRADRISLAERLAGAEGVPGGDGTVPQLLAMTNGLGADCVIVAAASKSAIPLQLALRACRDRGRIVIVGAVDVSVPWLEAYLKEVQILMARAYGPGSYDPAFEQQGKDYPLPYVRWTEQRNMQEFLRRLADGSVRVDELITHRFALADAPGAYDIIMDPGSGSLAVVLEYPSRALGKAVPVREKVSRVAVAPPRSGEVRAALIGAGNIARWAHVPSLQGVRGVTLRAVQSGSGMRAKSYATRYGAAYCTTSYEQILQDPEIDMVVIATRNPAHGREALAALKAGKHVFVEKPMALTIDECRELIEAQRTSAGKLTVGFNRRFAPTYVAQRRAMAGRQGPWILDCRVNSPGISGAYWMADPSIGGAILGEACHFTDLMSFLLDSEPVEVTAAGFPAGMKEPVAENNLAATIRFEDGSVASLTYCTVGSATSGGERMEVFGPGVGLHASDFKRFTKIGSKAGGVSSWFAQKGYGTQMQSFVDAIRSGKAPAVTVEDGARATVVCLALMDAARTGRPVPADWRTLIA